MPDLKGRSRDDVVKLLDGLGLSYEFKGKGLVISQKPEPGTEIDENSNVEVEFSETKE